MGTKIVTYYQSWVGEGHPYIEFDYDKVAAEGLYAVIAKYEQLLIRFLKLPANERQQGVIYGGTDYDFQFIEVKVDG